MDKHENKEILFLNKPIIETSQDIIGIDTHVKKLNCAIDAGAQMIAITAPFGSGKTSIIELVEKERKSYKEQSVIENGTEGNLVKEDVRKGKNKDKKKREKERKKAWEKQRKHEKIIKVSMWSQLQEINNGSTNDLHRSFIY